MKYCTKGCKEISATERVHRAFAQLLKSIVAKEEVMDLYAVILKSFFGRSKEERLAKVKGIETQINKNTGRTNTAMQMMLDGEIDTAEYRQIKSTYAEANTTLLKQRASLEIDNVEYAAKINRSFNLLKNADRFYEDASVEIKHNFCV